MTWKTWSRRRCQQRCGEDLRSTRQGACNIESPASDWRGSRTHSRHPSQIAGSPASVEYAITIAEIRKGRLSDHNGLSCRIWLTRAALGTRQRKIR